MELHDYLIKKEYDITKLINSSNFKNQYGQFFARKMRADFQPTYEESNIWGYALFLSSTSAKVLINKQSEVCNQGLKIAAELFETFSIVSDEYDREYARILSALCYDLSGYQANAACILRSINYTLEEKSSNDTSINELLKNLVLLLKRQLQAIPITPLMDKNVVHSEIENLNISWKNAVSKFKDYQLSGNFVDYEQDISEAVKSAISLKDATLTTILLLLKLKIEVSNKRSIWSVLSDEIYESPDTWKPYLNLLALNPYQDNKIVPPNKRLSQVELWKSQITAVRSGILKNNNGFIIQMPTSAGKTLIAELTILQQIGKNKKCLYIAPFRSLVNEIENTLNKHLSKLGYSVSSLTGSYEIDELDQFWMKEADVLVATPEKVDFLIRVQPDLFSDISLFVIDEGHVLGNLDSRSAQFELLLTRLKRWFTPKGCRFIFISAVMPDSDSSDFAKWLLTDENAKIQSPREYDGNMWQPTRRLLGYFSWDQQINFQNHVENSGQDIYIPNFISPLKWNTKKGKTKSFPQKLTQKAETTALLAYRYLREGSVLIYCATVGRNRGAGVYSVLKAFQRLIDTLDNEYASEFQLPIINDSEALEASIRWYGEDNLITKCIRRGIAPHFGDLADEVRRAVENDYTKKIIKILVATHTLGQGVNLPIKTLLVYSLDINANPKNRLTVKVRDFWNIVGRAGRAGRETEGQIVFVINNYRDKLLYDKYKDISELERVQSIFTVAMQLFQEGRITQEVLEETISDFAEPSLMNFLVEEVIDTPDQKLIESLIGDTLFKIQSLNENTNHINNLLLNNAERFWEIDSREKKVVFSRTGLSLRSCLLIEETLRNDPNFNLDLLIDGNEEVFLNIALKCLYTCSEMQPKNALKNIPIIKNTELEPFIKAWIHGASIIELKPLWTNAVGDQFDELMNVYIEDCLSYKYPWGITSIIFIASFILNEDWHNFSKEIISFPSKLKHGLSSSQSLWLRGAGVLSREVCTKLSERSEGGSNIRDFIAWFANITQEELHSFGIHSKYSLRNIFTVVSKINLKNDRPKEKKSFPVKGIRYETNRVELAKKLKVGDQLILQRQMDNEYDPFAIKVFSDNEQLGFIPREIAKYYAYQIDILEVEFSCIVTDKYGINIQIDVQTK